VGDRFLKSRTQRPCSPQPKVRVKLAQSSSNIDISPKPVEIAPNGGRRKVLLIGPGPGTRGGIAQFNSQLARVLRDGGTDATILAYRRIYPSFSRAGRQGRDPSRRQEDVSSAAVLVPWLPWTWFRARRVLRSRSPQIVVVQWWHPITSLSTWYLARFAKRRLRARVVFVCHNASPHEGFPLARALTRLALGSGDRLVALSEGVAGELRSLVPTARVSVVPHPPYSVLDAAVPIANREKWDARVGGVGGTKIVLFFGNVRPYKGLADLIDAFPQVARASNAILVVAGTFFEPIDSYRARVDELGIRDSVRLFDEYIPNEDVASLFDMSDLVVLPYRTASQSGVIPLAAMFRKPVVTTNVGGLPEALAGSGVVVPPNDPEALGDAVVAALQTPPAPPPSGEDLWSRWRDAVLSS
jgi:glycosyltransferase involved in cell wall biosynthesis